MFIKSYDFEVKWSTAFKIFTFPISFVLTAILFRALSIEEYAFYAICVTIFYQIAQLDFGLFAYTKTKIPKVANNYKSLSKTVESIFGALFIITCGLILISIIFSDQILHSWISFNETTALNHLVSNIFSFKLFLIAALFNNIIYFVLHLNASLGRSYLLVVTQVLSSFLLLIFVFISIVLEYASLPTFLNLFVASILFSNLILAYKSFRVFKSYSIQISFPSYKDMHHAFISGIPFFILQLIAVIFILAPRIFGYYALGASEAALQDLFTRLLTPIIAINAVISLPAWTRFAAQTMNNSDSSPEKVIKSQNLILIFLMCLITILCYFGQSIMYYWVGDGAPMIDTSTSLSFSFLFSAFLLYVNTASLTNGLNQLMLQAKLGIFGLLILLGQLYYFNYINLLNLATLNFSTGVGMIVFGLIGRMISIRELKNAQSKNNTDHNSI